MANNQQGSGSKTQGGTEQQHREAGKKGGEASHGGTGSKSGSGSGSSGGNR